MGFQHLTYPVPLRPWAAEKLWHPAWKGQSAAIVVPVVNFTQGPSGLAYCPGTGLGSNYEHYFLVCDFKGEGGGIHSLSVRPNGASFELVNPAHFIWRIPATDVEFAPDGSVYDCTWNGNINAQSKAYIYKIIDPRVSGDPLVAKTQRAIAGGMTRRNETQLTQWLGHPDLRVRREAQFELVERGAPSVAAFEGALQHQTNTLPRLQLDVLEAAGLRPTLKASVARYHDGLNRKGILAPYRETLAGGNAIAGRKIFQERPDVSCVRCHKIGNDGGDVGPNLAGIGQKQPREYLLESLVAPNAKIAPGFEGVTLTMKIGTLHAGSVKQETSDELVLNSPEEGFLTLRKSDITDRQRGLSGMPEGVGQMLSKRDLRDLIEFLTTLK